MAKKLYKYTQYPPFYLNQYSWGGDSIAGIGGALTSIVGAGVNNAQIGDTSSIENNIQNTQNLKFSGSTNDALMQSWQQYNPLDNVSYKDVRGGSNSQRIMSTLGSAISGAGAGAQVGGGLGAAIGGAVGLGSGIWGLLAGNKKANQKTAELNAKIAQANQQAVNNFGNSVQNIDNNTDLNLLANYAAYGGKMNKMSNGGHTHGAEWDNGITLFDNGNTHEQNPNGGVQIGVDPQGVPNMVEEGEVKYNDYIFSNRITMPKEFKKQYKLKNNSTFADAAKKLSKESEERPNDPISKSGLDARMTKLTQLQEFVKAQQEPQQQSDNNIFGDGGYYGNGNLLMKDPQKRIVNDPLILSNPKIYTKNEDPFLISVPWSQKADMNKFVDTSKPKENVNNIVNNNYGLDTSFLRYAPAIGSGIGVFSDLMGWTNKPNYDNANMITDAVRNTPNVQFNPIGNQMTYKPLDRNYYLNQLYSNAGASRRDIINQSGGNRATAMAGILGADYNTTSNIGKLAREAEEYNLNQRQKVEDFNRSTNMFNSEGSLKAQTANQANYERKLRAIMAASEMRQQADMLSSQGKSANLTNFFDNIGNVGREAFSQNQVNWEIDKGLHGGYSLEDIFNRRGTSKSQNLALARTMYSDEELKKAGYLKYGGKVKRKGLTF